MKGGLLIAACIGIDLRSTMDMDATIINYPISEVTLRKAVAEIMAINLDDDVEFSLVVIEPIRKDDLYGGFRVSIQAD